MFVLCVLYSKYKRHLQDNEDKVVVQMKYREQKKNPGGGKFFRTRPDWPWGPPSHLYTAYRPGRGVNHPLPPSADVKERVELYLYSPSRPSWPVLGRNLPSFIFSLK